MSSIQQDISTPQEFGLLSATETGIGKEITEVATAGGVKFELKDKASVKKLWMLCRKGVEGISGSGKAAITDQDAPLTVDEIKEIKGLCSKVHGFVIPEAWIIAPRLVGRTSRDFTRSPPRLEVILAESLRPRSCAEKAPGAMI